MKQPLDGPAKRTTLHSRTRRKMPEKVEIFCHWSTKLTLSRDEKIYSVEISAFFYHSDITLNQFWGYLKRKISHFTTFRSSEFSLLWNFAFFEVWNLDQMNKIPSHFDYLSSSEFWIFGHYWHSLVWISPKMKNSKPPKWSKLQFLTFRSQSKLISRKMEFAGKLLNFHTVEFPHSKFLRLIIILTYATSTNLSVTSTSSNQLLPPRNGSLTTIRLRAHHLPAYQTHGRNSCGWITKKK